MTPLKAGTTADYDNSMAAAMEHAFMAEWPRVMGNMPLPESNNQMRLLFAAIAQGVVNHLVAQHLAFGVNQNSANMPAGYHIDIDSTH